MLKRTWEQKIITQKKRCFACLHWIPVGPLLQIGLSPKEWRVAVNSGPFLRRVCSRNRQMKAADQSEAWVVWLCNSSSGWKLSFRQNHSFLSVSINVQIGVHLNSQSHTFFPCNHTVLRTVHTLASIVPSKRRSVTRSAQYEQQHEPYQTVGDWKKQIEKLNMSGFECLRLCGKKRNWTFT